MSVNAADPEPAPKQTVQDAYLQMHKEMASGNKEKQSKALKAMMPTKKDLEYLFPKHADKLWPGYEEENKSILKSVDMVAKEITRRGEVEKIEATDVRKDKDDSEGRYKRVLAMIPKDVPVFKLLVRKKNSSSGSPPFVYVNKRWILMRGLDDIPQDIDDLEKKQKSK